MAISAVQDTFTYLGSDGKVREAEGVFMGSTTGGVFTPATFLPPGRAAAGASVPTVLSTEDKAALDAANSGYTNASVYVNNTARAAGRGILAVISTAGTATWTFGGVDIVFTLALGPTILPLAVTKTVLGTAVGSFYAIS